MIDAAQVKKLRDLTGAGMMDCKRALEEANGDLDKAVEILRKKGLAQAARRAGRAAGEGIIESYIHAGGRIGVLVELNCETDFVARTEEFHSLAHDIAMQVAASSPQYVSKEEVPEAVLAKEREILLAQAENTGKPAAVLEKLVAGRLEKFYQEVCLLEQPFIRDPKKTVKDLVLEHVAKLGENITVRRFARFAVGESLPEEAGN